MRFVWLSAALMVVIASCSDTDSTPVTASTASATSTPLGTSTGGDTSTVAVPRLDLDACVLVDATDAASILGSEATVDTTPAANFGEVSFCAWITGSDALLTVSVFEGRQFYGGDDGTGAEPLNVGDEGFIGVEPTFGGVVIQFLQDDWVVTLSATPFGVVDVEGLPAAMTRVAQQVADQLP